MDMIPSMRLPLERLLVFLWSILPSVLCANSEVRMWRLTDGSTLQAEIASVDEPNARMVLRTQAGEEKSVSLDALEKTDRAWVLEWIEMNEALAAKVGELGGRLEHFPGKGEKFQTGFHVFHPAGNVDPAAPRPLLILFDPSGLPMRYLLRHIEAANETKMTLVTCDYFSNRMLVEEGRERFTELFPLIAAAVPHDPKKIFLGGTSGGALRAFVLSAQCPWAKVAGIYSNGGWLGGAEFKDEPFPAGRICMVNGDKDHAAQAYLDEDMRVLHSRGCLIGLFAFEGGHQIPPPPVQAKAFRWLLGAFD